MSLVDQSLLSAYFTYYSDKFYVDNVNNSIIVMERLLDVLGYNPGRTDGYFSQGE